MSRPAKNRIPKNKTKGAITNHGNCPFLFYHFMKKMEKKYYENNQCCYCGKLEGPDAGTPEGWFGLDEDGDKVCDDCRDLQQFRATKAKQSAAAKKTNEFLKKNKPNHYRAAVAKRWAKRSLDTP